MKITTKYETVKRLLEKEPRYRDDYRSLIAAVWQEEMGDEIITAPDFFNLFRLGEFSHPESIMRLRRMVQEDFPELGGKYRDDRIKNRTMEVKKELGYY